MKDTCEITYQEASIVETVLGNFLLQVIRDNENCSDDEMEAIEKVRDALAFADRIYIVSPTDYGGTPASNVIHVDFLSADRAEAA